MQAYTYIERGKFELLDKPKPELRRSARCHCARNAGQYLHQRPAYQARQRASRRTGRYRRPRNGRYRRTSRPGRHFDQARRPGNGQCRNFLRRVLFLQARVCEQLCRSGRRLGVRLPYRRRPGRVRARAPCRSGIEPYSRHGRRRAGACSWATFWPRVSGPPGSRKSAEEDTVLIIGAGPTGICTLLCVMLNGIRNALSSAKSRPNESVSCKSIIPKCWSDRARGMPGFRAPATAITAGPTVVLEVAGADDTFRLAWECARPHAVVTVVALYDRPQTLPLPDMYGKNLTFKTGGVDGCDCAEILRLIATGPDRHRAAHYAPFSTEPYRRGLSPFRKPAGRSNQSGDRMRQITATAPTIDIPII